MVNNEHPSILELQSHANEYHEAFTISLKEFSETVESLWPVTKQWMALHPNYLIPADHPENLMKFITDDNEESYNLCHFWSNFEV
jgi:alpha 1,2-mannosyltransferase